MLLVGLGWASTLASLTETPPTDAGPGDAATVSRVLWPIKLVLKGPSRVGANKGEGIVVEELVRRSLRALGGDRGSVHTAVPFEPVLPWPDKEDMLPEAFEVRRRATDAMMASTSVVHGSILKTRNAAGMSGVGTTTDKVLPSGLALGSASEGGVAEVVEIASDAAEDGTESGSGNGGGDSTAGGDASVER